MSKFARMSFALTLAGFMFAGFSASAKTASPAPSDLGNVAPAAAADREIDLTPSTKWVNVDNGETVSFVENGKRLTWTFNTYDNVNFDLNKIAQKDFGFPTARVFVAPNPTYAG